VGFIPILGFRFALVCDEDCILDLFFEEIVCFDLLISCWEISGHGACACGSDDSRKLHPSIK
jgi:hypothetical protein